MATNQIAERFGAVAMTLEAGEMSLHHVNMVHGSKANDSDEMRIGYAVRYVAPSVRQSIPHHDVLLVRGRDNSGHYHHGVPPRDDDPNALAAHAAFVAGRQQRRNDDA